MSGSDTRAIGATPAAVHQGDTAPLWCPAPEAAARSAIMRFTRFAEARTGQRFESYAALHRWSVEDPETFWMLLWEHCAPLCSVPPAGALRRAEVFERVEWFPGARLNFAENLLRFRDEHVALVFRSEDGTRSEWTYAQLAAAVAAAAAALRAVGVGPGDRVAAFVPNLPEVIVAMLAATSIGAVWSSCSPDFGISGVVDRFGQIEPKVLFVADGYRYGGKRFDSLGKAREIVAAIPRIAKVVVIPFLEAAPSLDGLPRAVTFRGFLDATAGAPTPEPAELRFEQLPADHPLCVLYSSGTTGRPKCIVHRAGGALIQHYKEHLIHGELERADRFFFFTTCGWMMWNWLVGGLVSGCTLVLYDGSPFHEEGRVLWRLAAEEKITVFGCGAKFLASCERAGVRPGAQFDLGALRLLYSTGSPLAPEGYDYVYRDVKADVLLASISGGTDILAAFTVGNAALPVWRGEMQCRGLGMAVDVFDDRGYPVPPGTKGELVCTQPFPSMPLGFWGDADGRRYHAAYFSRFAGLWAHGDYAELTSHGGLVIHGRSDSVLNPGGVRIGTAEIYRQLEHIPEIVDSVVVGQDWESDVRVVLFVVLREGAALTDALRERICAVIRAGATPRHVPARILAVPDIPRTRSGKIVELAVRSVVHGRAIDNLDAIANPQALECFHNRSELAV